MKNIKTVAAGAILGLGICGVAIAQVHHGAHRHDGLHHFKDSASAVEHLTEFYPRFAAFDVNKDGQLDAAENEALVQAIIEGRVQLPGQRPESGGAPSAEAMVNHIAGMFTQFAAYDVNHDGVFDATEQAALRAGIESGELQGP